MKIDERALDLGFQELDRATADGEDELAAFRKGIEAYEAARPDPNPWRPIDGLKLTGKEILVAFPPFNVEPEFANEYSILYDEEALLNGETLKGTMFRYLDPPPQQSIVKNTQTISRTFPKPPDTLRIHFVDDEDPDPET